MFTKLLPSFGTGLKISSKILSVLVVSVFSLTALLSTTANAQSLSEKEVMADIQKDSNLFTPELIEKADKYVAYGDTDALVLQTIDVSLTKDEVKLVRKGVMRYNLLSKETKRDSSLKNKEKFGHTSDCGTRSSGWAWWGFWQYFTGCYLESASNNTGFVYSVVSIAFGVVCAGCGAASGAYTAGLVWKFNDCKNWKGYAYLNTNWAGIPWVSC